MQVLLQTEVTELEEYVAEEYIQLSLKRVEGRWTQSRGKEYFYEATKLVAEQLVRARFVVGCDGSRSVVRRYLNPGNVSSLIVQSSSIGETDSNVRLAIYFDEL